MTDDFFRSRLDQMIEHSHPLAVLASRLPWDKMESRVGPQFAHKERPLLRVEESPDLAGPGRFSELAVVKPATPVAPDWPCG